MIWSDLLAVQRTLKSHLWHHSSKWSILRCSAFFIVQISHPYMATGKIIVFDYIHFVGKIMCLLFNMLSRLIITFLPRNEHLLIEWLQLPSSVVLETPKINSATVSIWSHHFMTNRWVNSGNSGWLYFSGLQNQCLWWLQPWTEIILPFLRLHPSIAFQTLLLTMRATPFLLRDSCPL